MSTNSVKKPAVSNKTKATAVGGGAGVLLPYLATLASAKWGVPVEVAFAAVGGVAALLGRWAAKLSPGE